jgi:hypothetical protein
LLILAYCAEPATLDLTPAVGDRRAEVDRLVPLGPLGWESMSAAP